MSDVGTTETEEDDFDYDYGDEDPFDDRDWD